MSHTPASTTKMPDKESSPPGTKRSKFPDGESANCGCEMPLKPKDYLQDAAGKK